MKYQKIKTITCHEVYNYGASLQEYALLKYLQNLGHDAEAIHYKPDYLSGHYNLWGVSNPKYGKNIFLKYAYLMAKLPSRLIALKRKNLFDVFSAKYIKTGTKLYKSNTDLQNNIPEADAYICGSDQIWNSFFKNGKDPAFYLDFVPDDKLKISYAASFATETIEDTIKSFVQEKVNRIDCISVRETSGLTILDDLKIVNAEQVLDPVFLLDRDYWEKEFVKDPIKEKYILIYDFDTNIAIRKTAKILAKKNGLKIYAVNQNINYADKNFWLKGPETFLNLVVNASLILSNSFHSVAFSIIFKKQFYVFNRKEKINTRMKDLLNLINASYLLIDDENLEEVSLRPVNNYVEIEMNIVLARKRSEDFLKSALR